MESTIVISIMLFYLFACFIPRFKALGKNTIDSNLIIKNSGLDVKVYLKILIITYFFGSMMIREGNVEAEFSSILIISGFIFIVDFLCYLKILKILLKNYVIFEDKLLSSNDRSEIENDSERRNLFKYFRFEKFNELYKLFIRVNNSDFNAARYGKNYYIVARRGFYVCFDKETYRIIDSSKLCTVESLVDNKVVKKHKEGFYY